MNDLQKRESRRGERRLSKLDRRENWSAANTPGIISEKQAASRLFMPIRQFRLFAERHDLASMEDGTGEIYRSIGELEDLAKKLGLRIQLELPWGDAA